MTRIRLIVHPLPWFPPQFRSHPIVKKQPTG